MEQRRRTASKFFPIYQPALNLDFRNGALPPEITFSRASTATFVGSDGLIQTAAANVPRFNYNPALSAIPRLLVEAEARTNLAIRSEEFDNAAWFKAGTATVTPNTNTAPDGNLSADTLNMPASGDRISLTPIAVTGGSTVTASLWLSGVGTTYLALSSSGGTFKFAQTLINLTPTLTRHQVTLVTNADNTGVFPIIGRYNGAVGAGTATEAVIWGYQFEAAAFSSSYIPTTTVAVTRAADICAVTGGNFGKWFNPWAGTFACKAVRSNAGGVTGVLLGVSQAGDFNNSMYYSNTAGAGSQLNFAAITGGVPQASINANPAAITSVFKTAVSYGPQQFAVSTDNQAPQLDNSGAIAANMAILSIGQAPWILGAPWMGEFEYIRYWQQDADPKMVQYLTSSIYD